MQTSQSGKHFFGAGWGGGGWGGEGGSHFLDPMIAHIYGKAPSERGTFFKLQVYQKGHNSRVEK